MSILLEVIVALVALGPLILKPSFIIIFVIPPFVTVNVY
jgi:hypothetical protein